jgi:hypothetical protein
MRFEIDEDIYEITSDGIIHHINPKPFIYDQNYVSCYNKEGYQRGTEVLQAMRYAFAVGVHGRPIRSLTDYGYGQGDFMKFVKRQISYVSGFDLTRVHVDGCDIVDKLSNVDVITFNDALEHVPDIGFVENLPCETVVISLPNCQYHIKGLEWFKNWFHRKPSEHLHFFDEESLIKFMSSKGWKHKATSRHEDIIRERGDDWNILTCGFKR